MIQYTELAEYYDALTDEIPYDAMANRLWSLLQKGKLAPRLCLELGCGTGNISKRLCEKGLELIAVDNSPEMLNVAREKCIHLGTPPLFICQDMDKLDLYGTVQAAISTLDSINYLPNLQAVGRTFAKVHLFLESRGLFIFDLKTPAMFEAMAGTASVYEQDGLFCTWQYGYRGATGKAVHTIDVFVESNGKYSRFTEEHIQRAFTKSQIEEQLRSHDFKLKGVYQDYSTRKADTECGRLLYVAEKR